MNEKEINKHLKNGISEIAPDCFDEIMEKISNKEDITDSKIISKKGTTQRVITSFASVAACFLLLVSSYNLYQRDNQKVDTIVAFDVNPSIEFGVNKSEKVVTAIALNDDGQEILEHLSLEKENLKEATLVVMDELVKQGFITQEKSTVLVSVENDNREKTEEIKEDLSEEIVKHLEKEDIKATVLKQTIVEDEVSEHIAKEYNISKGKALLIKSAMEENADLKEEELAKMTVDEIAEKKVGKDIAVTQVPKDDTKANKNNKSNATVLQEDNKPTSVPKNEMEDTQKDASENENKAEPTKLPENENKVKPTKQPENENKVKPTKIPENENKAKPTKQPESENKVKPTKIPENENKAKPTKQPENENKPKPTKTPEDDRKVEPTRLPEDDRKAKPTQLPEDDRKGKQTQLPEDDRKAKPTQMPGDDRRKQMK